MKHSNTTRNHKAARRRTGLRRTVAFALAPVLALAVSLTVTHQSSQATIVRHIATYYYGGGSNSTALAPASAQNPQQKIIVTWRPGTTNQPWIILIHGGSWRYSDPESLGTTADFFSKEGFDVFNIAYPLLNPPTVPWSSTRAGVVDARNWIRSHASVFGINPNRGAVFGFSAGGHLALELGLAGDGNTGIKAIVTASAVAQPIRVADDALGMRPTTEPATTEEQALYQSEMLATGCPVTTRTTNCINAWNNFSPQSEISPHDPPVLMYAGADDVVVPYQSDTAMQYWLRRQGVPATVNIVPNMGHDIHTAFDGSTGPRTTQLLNFLRQYTK